MNGSPAVADLFVAARRCFVAVRPGVEPAAQTMIDTAVGVLDEVADGLRVVETLPASTIGATRHLGTLATEPAIGRPPADAVATDAGDLISLLHRTEALLPWTRTVGYLDVLSAHYLDNYGYVQLVGPTDVSLVRHDAVRVGLGLWGPHLDYPEHHHPAEELYLTMAGCPEFSVDGGEFAAAPIGTGVHMSPHRVHALRFGEAPTLVLYVWTGDVVTDAVLADGVVVSP